MNSGEAVCVSAIVATLIAMKLHRLCVLRGSKWLSLTRHLFAPTSALARLEFPENATLKLIVQHRHRGGQMRAQVRRRRRPSDSAEAVKNPSCAARPPPLSLMSKGEFYAGGSRTLVV